VKWVGEENGLVGEWDEGGSRPAEEPGRAEVAPAASLDSTRRSEKAKGAGEGITGSAEAESPENVRAHIHIQTRTLLCPATSHLRATIPTSSLQTSPLLPLPTQSLLPSQSLFPL
jgi:hypothetical protein